MDYAAIETLRDTHPAWRMLRADQAPLLLSFLGRFFVDEIHYDATPALEKAYAFPMSQDITKYRRLTIALTLFRLTMGQPRQEDMVELLERRGLATDWLSPRHSRRRLRRYTVPIAK